MTLCDVYALSHLKYINDASKVSLIASLNSLLSYCGAKELSNKSMVKIRITLQFSNLKKKKKKKIVKPKKTALFRSKGVRIPIS